MAKPLRTRLADTSLIQRFEFGNPREFDRVKKSAPALAGALKVAWLERLSSGTPEPRLTASFQGEFMITDIPVVTRCWHLP
jgi:hypothetical protein